MSYEISDGERHLFAAMRTKGEISASSARKAMAKIVINNHEDTCMECPEIGCKKGLNTGKPFIRDCCICPACTIAAKYK